MSGESWQNSGRWLVSHTSYQQALSMDLSMHMHTHVIQGNTGAKGAPGPGSAYHQHHEQIPTPSPPSPGSPLVYSAHSAMEPLKADATGMRPTTSEYQAITGWPATPKQMPCVVVCESGLREFLSNCADLVRPSILFPSMYRIAIMALLQK